MNTTTATTPTTSTMTITIERTPRTVNLEGIAIQVEELSVRLPFARKPADLSEVVTRVLARMETQFSQGNFVVQTDIATALPRVLADEGATEQAIENLLANAIKYSGEAKRIEVRAQRNGDHVEISVTDHGVGISRREQGRIFRKFYRIPNSNTRRQNGVGLGLYIVKNIAKFHGGSAQVVPLTAPMGNEFSIRIPVMR